MMTSNEFSEAISDIHTAVPDEISRYAIEGLKVGYVKESLLYGNSLTDEDLEILTCFFLPNMAVVHSDLGIIESILAAKNFMREQTHGAVTLAKIYLSDSLYNELVENTGVEKGKQYRVTNVDVLSCPHFTDGWMIGIGKCKFDLTTPENLLIWMHRNAKE